MNRAAVAAATLLVTLAGGGCVVGPAQGFSDVVIYWEFDRYTFIRGVEGVIHYDPNVNPGGRDRGCPESGVDTIDVLDAGGFPLVRATPCIFGGVQGVIVPAVPFGTQRLTVVGYRNGIALYQGDVTVSVPQGPSPTDTAFAAGIPSRLTVHADVMPMPIPLTCAQGSLGWMDGWLMDSFGSVVWYNQVPCPPAAGPGIEFGLVDRDVYWMWMDAVNLTGGVVASVCSNEAPNPVQLFSDRVLTATLPAGTCSNPPPPNVP